MAETQFPKVDEIVYQVKGKKIKAYRVVGTNYPWIQTEQRSALFKEHEWGATAEDAKKKLLAYKNARKAILQSQLDKINKEIAKIDLLT